MPSFPVVTPRKRIVVVDDDAYVRRVVESALRREGFEVVAFEDPRDALAQLRDVAPDLILCDVLMPFMDGRALFREVKDTPKLKDVPFVFLSGLLADDEIVDTLEKGADDFLSKPFNVPRLLAKVRSTLRLAERRHDALSGPVGPGGTLPLLNVAATRFSRILPSKAFKSGGDSGSAGSRAGKSKSKRKRKEYRLNIFRFFDAWPQRFFAPGFRFGRSRRW